MTKVHENQFTLIQGESDLGLYQWNTNTAKHYFCKQCGICPFHRKRVSPDFFGINVHCLDDVDLSDIPVIEVDGATMSTCRSD